jgi:hypothetical protein
VDLSWVCLSFNKVAEEAKAMEDVTEGQEEEK